MTTSYIDPEFGEIIIRKTAQARSIRIKLGTDGRFVVSAPKFTPLAFIKLTIKSSHENLKKLAAEVPRDATYIDGQNIGQAHQLSVVPTEMVKKPKVFSLRNKLIVQLPPTSSLDDAAIQQQIRDEAIKILRREAKAYLPDRLANFADQHGFKYQRVRFSHSGSRWGSCSSTGTISLNIALMKLPIELVDYVLYHELCHTRQMNHSAAFWDQVGQLDPHYMLHRRQLKRFSPVV